VGRNVVVKQINIFPTVKVITMLEPQFYVVVQLRNFSFLPFLAYYSAKLSRKNHYTLTKENRIGY